MVKAAGNHRGDLVAARLQLKAADGLGHLAHGAVVEERLAGPLVAHQPRALLDPDALARLVAIDLGDEILHLAALNQNPMELGPPVGIDVPLAGDVVDLVQHLGLAGETVEPDERRVGADHVAVERRAEDALADVVVEVAKAVLGRPHLQEGEVPVDGKNGKRQTG